MRIRVKTTLVKYLLSIVSFSSIRQNISSAKTVNSKCIEAHDKQYNARNSVFVQNAESLFDYVDTSLEVIPTGYEPLFDYSRAKVSNNRQYTAMRDECNRLGYHLCDVTTEVEFKDDFGNFHYGREILKPVCFPNTCSDYDIGIVDPAPMKCDTEEEELHCDISKRIIYCPNRNVPPGNCTADFLNMTNSDLGNRADNLKDRVEDECSDLAHGKESKWCYFDSDDFGLNEVPMVVTHDYTDLRGNSYTQMAVGCLKMGYSFCRADTVVQTARNTLFEVNKPVCVPNTCTEEDVRLVNPDPLHCEEGDDHCEIVSMNMKCPRGSPIGSEEGDCLSDFDYMIDENVQNITSMRNRIISRAEGDCVDAINYDRGGACSVQTPRYRTVVDDFTPMFLNDTYDEFALSCTNKGSRACVYTATIKFETRNATDFIYGTDTVVNFPICRPIECTSHDIINGVIFDEFGCAEHHTHCDIEVIAEDCGPDYPSAAPSAPPTRAYTDPPTTASPTNQPSSSPTVASSTKPTQVSSKLPSSVPSSQSSAEPSISSVPTEATSPPTTTMSPSSKATTASPTDSENADFSSATAVTSATTTSRKSHHLFFLCISSAFMYYFV